jgi:phosphoribosylformylglycinamidine synthase PurS subunit
VARVVVDVMPKPEILDPQGKAVAGALPRLGFTGITEVRQGKRFELEVEGEMTPERWAEVHDIAEKLLSNPVIEDFDVYVELTEEEIEEQHGSDEAWSEGQA